MGLQQSGAAALPPPAGAGELSAALAGTLLQANAASPSRIVSPHLKGRGRGAGSSGWELKAVVGFSA